MTSNIVLALAGLILAVVVHIVVIARWSGRIDAQQKSASERDEAHSKLVEHRFGEHAKILELVRERLHKVEGELQRLKGVLQYLQRRVPDDSD